MEIITVSLWHKTDFQNKIMHYKVVVVSKHCGWVHAEKVTDQFQTDDQKRVCMFFLGDLITPGTTSRILASTGASLNSPVL